MARTESPEETERARRRSSPRRCARATSCSSPATSGAGKTTFVRGALRALGVTEPVTSPTFVVGLRYDGAAGPVAHLDLYRLAGLGDEDPGLLDPYFGPDTITFVEWPEQAGRRAAAERRVAAPRRARARGRRPRRWRSAA